MDFTYNSYRQLLDMFNLYGYHISSYEDADSNEKSVIIRHDIDFSLEKTIKMGEIEEGLGIKSTFFLLISTDFYNVFSANGISIIKKLQSYGHEIGLHFDEMKYPDFVGNPDRIRESILKEARILSYAAECPITKVSMHRPSKEIIASDLMIPGMINTYGQKYIKDYKYLSDSRRNWREPIEDYIRNNSYDRFQILIHPFWYNESDFNIKESVLRFLHSAIAERYSELNGNITDLNKIILFEEIE